jgi:2-succinyl-6-hydroxy-2,4-cyclohexadiene-1-carboxylate synthase
MHHSAPFVGKTLLVAGEKDVKFHEIATEMARACPAAELCVVEGCGHNVHYEDPAAYTRCVKQFLSRCSGFSGNA